ncbi:MAG: hypothetical protein V4449_02175 [Patescibacteria group bacterium]
MDGAVEKLHKLTERDLEDAIKIPGRCIELLNSPDSQLERFPLHVLGPFLLQAVKETRNAGQKIEFHPLGIARLSFSDSRHSTGYHLHLFSHDWPTNNGQIETPHTHRFTLLSKILKGRLQNRIWKITEDPNGEYMSIPVESNPTTSDLAINEARPVSIELGEVKDVNEGEVYSMGIGECHTTEYEDDVMTLIRKIYINPRSNITAPRVGDAADVGVDQDHYAYPEELQRLGWARIETYLKSLSSKGKPKINSNFK